VYSGEGDGFDSYAKTVVVQLTGAMVIMLTMVTVRFLLLFLATVLVVKVVITKEVRLIYMYKRVFAILLRLYTSMECLKILRICHSCLSISEGTVPYLIRDNPASNWWSMYLKPKIQ
jgi:hypothetical protein